MACKKDLPTNSAILQDNTDSNATETTPLVVRKSAVNRSGVLRRLRESVFIKSKAANMILFWSFLAYFLYGIVLDPNNSFLLPLERYPFYMLLSDTSNRTFSITIGFVYVIGSGVYSAIAVWLLFYPLAGYLADIRYGRYRVVLCSLRIMWFALIFLIIGVIVFNGIFWPIIHVTAKNYVDSFLYYGVIMGILGLFAFIIMSIGFAAFSANAIQFGIDQLQDFPVRDSFLFVYWYLLMQYIGIGIGKLV